MSNERSMRKVAATALGGTSIEWYDFFLYGAAAALILASCFSFIVFLVFSLFTRACYLYDFFEFISPG